MIAAPPGLEPAMDLARVELSPQKEVVRKFYKDMWDHADITLIPEIFQPDFTFRGSLGPVLVGYDQFADYVRWVTDSLENYTSDILALDRTGRPGFGQVPFSRHPSKADVRSCSDRASRLVVRSADLHIP